MEPLQPGEAPLYDAVGGEGRPVHSAILFRYHYSIGPGVVNEKNAKARTSVGILKKRLRWAKAYCMAKNPWGLRGRNPRRLQSDLAARTANPQKALRSKGFLA